MTTQGRNEDKIRMQLSNGYCEPFTRGSFCDAETKLESKKEEIRRTQHKDKKEIMLHYLTQGDGRKFHWLEIIRNLKLDIYSLKALKLMVVELQRLSGHLSDFEELLELGISREIREQNSYEISPMDFICKERSWANKPSGKQGEPIVFSTNCISDLLKWIPRQENGITGCQFHLWSKSILEEMSKVPCEIVVNEEKWMTNPEDNMTAFKNARKWYPKILNKEGRSGIYVLPKKTCIGDRYPSIMHEKWLLGSRDLIMRPMIQEAEDCFAANNDNYFRDYFTEHNLVCGSFNITDGAVKNYESLFFIDHIEGLHNSSLERQDYPLKTAQNSLAYMDKEDEAISYIEESNPLITRLRSSFDYMKSMSIQWEAYLNS